MDQCEFSVSFQGTEYPAFYITEIPEFKKAITAFMKKKCLIAIDTETMANPQYSHIKTAALSPLLSSIRLIQVFDGKSVIIFDMLSLEKFSGGIKLWKKFLESGRFIGHNSLFDLQFFMLMGIENMNIGCTYLLSKILFHAAFPTDEGLSASLKNLVKFAFKEEVAKENQASDWSVPDLTFEQIHYAALDAVYTLKLAEKLAPGLEKYKLQNTYKLLKDAQHPIASIQINGLGFDTERHREAIAIWRDKLFTAKKEVLELTGLEKLTGHTVGDWLGKNLENDILSLWPVTETGKLSTDSHTLSDFAFLPIVKPFSEFQRREKLTSSFGMGLIHLVNPESERLHPHFSLVGARTGRLSCSKPNCQQMPRSPDKSKFPDEPDIRDHFIPRPGYTFVCADFNNIEVRVGAELSRDETMLRAYREGIDIHKLTASTVSGKPIEEITKSDRQMAKALTFGLMFGLGPNKFAHYARQSYGVEVSPAEAFEAVQQWHELYAGYTDWQQRMVKVARTTLISKTPLGKIRKLAPDNFYGASMNTPVQGGAAEVMLSALCTLHKVLKYKNLKAYIVNVVHDEILVECDESSSVEDTKEAVEFSMREGFLHVFPEGITRGLVDAKVGASWAKAK